MHHDIFLELSLIIAIGSGIALVMRLLKQPLIIGHILTGIVVGPSVLSLINSAGIVFPSFLNLAADTYRYTITDRCYLLLV